MAFICRRFIMIIIILLSVIVLILVFCIIVLAHTLNEVRDEKDNDRYINTVNKNRVSMVEYYMRNYKEGGNPFTTLRDINNALKMDNEEVFGCKRDEKN